ncbi:hypothetical protein GJ496_011118 [Pomphorhynchus laevis]|nr:hypothetical protein GJ496_011118 [Pomphorhynchus laevis]
MSIHSSISNCNAPYSKLSQSSSDSSCSSMTDERYASCRPNKVVIIHGNKTNARGNSISVSKPIKGLLSSTPDVSNREYDSKVFDILLVDPDDFATQITLMDWPVFKSITLDELTSCAWNVKCKLQKAYNVVQFIRRFNHTNFWVQKEILHAQSHKSRVEILSRMIKVAKKLLDVNNLNGLMAVVTALLSAPIYRLDSCWNSISRRDRLAFNSLTELVSEEENRRKLRSHLAMTSLPCIPFLGLYLTDLIYIDTLHPHHGGMESSQRKIQMNNICRVISEFQQSDYTFLKPLMHVQSYLSSVRYIEELQKFAEDENYKLSLTIEPIQKDKYNNGICSMPPSSSRSDSIDHRLVISTESKRYHKKSFSDSISLVASVRHKLCKKDLLNDCSSHEDTTSYKSSSLQNSIYYYF